MYVLYVFRREGTRTRSWCCRTRCPVECGCASALTPPPRLWYWMPLSLPTCSTASTLATPTWGASLVCQVGPCQTWARHLFSSGHFIFKGFGVWFFFLQVSWRLIFQQVKRFTKTQRLAKVMGPAWGLWAVMVPWQRREPLPYLKQPAQGWVSRQWNVAASLPQVLECFHHTWLSFSDSLIDILDGFNLFKNKLFD